MNIPEHLIAYLKENDHAELLDFGTFYANYIPSHFDLKTRVITPPCRSLTFRPVKVNDTHFVEYIAAKEFISFDTARTFMQQYVAALKDQLNTHTQYQIGNIGSLSHRGDHEYTFSADRSLNLLDDAFAFTPLHDVKVFETTIEQPSPQQTAPSSSVSEPIIQESIPQSTPSQETSEKEETEFDVATIAEAEIEQSLENEEEETLSAKPNPKESAPPQETAITPSSDELKPQTTDATQTNTPSSQPGNEVHKTEKRPDHFEPKHCIETQHPSFRTQMKASDRYTRKRRRGWLILAILLLLLIALVALFFSMNGLTRISKLLSNKMQPAVPVETPVSETPTAQPADTLDLSDTLSNQEYTLVQAPPANSTSVAQTSQPADNKNVAPAPPKPVIPKTIQQQDFSRKGFDIIGGSFASLSNAEAAAKKAFAQGFQSYLIVKTEKGNNIYFVSYGSYRSLTEANRNLQEVINKTGSQQFYVKSF